MSREDFAVLAAQTGDMHVGWVAFPSDAEEQCSASSFRDSCTACESSSANITAAVLPPAGWRYCPLWHITIATNIQVCDKSF
jgi:hypothetical protein